MREQYAFETSLDGNKTFQPYYNFQSAGVTITPSHTSGTIRTFTTSADYFNSAQVGTRLLIGETEVVITGFTDAQNVTGNIKGTIQKQLDIDAIKTKKDVSAIEIAHVNHGLASGASVTIANAGGVGGISASNINGTRTISRIIDENK